MEQDYDAEDGPREIEILRRRTMIYAKAGWLVALTTATYEPVQGTSPR